MMSGADRCVEDVADNHIAENKLGNSVLVVVRSEQNIRGELPEHVRGSVIERDCRYSEPIGGRKFSHLVNSVKRTNGVALDWSIFF